jgi:pyridoxine 4-dehydrogenase
MPETLTIGGDLPVRRLGLGAMSLTGRGVWGEPADLEGARRLLRRALELGVNFVDTADSYGPEVSERLIAEALHPYPDGLVIATKGGFRRRGPHDWYPDGRPEHLRAACEGSLRRLKLERIDLYQLHTVDPDVPLEESVGALHELRDEGKVRHVGVCNVDRAQLERARAVAPIVSVQNRYNVADRAHEPVLAECERDGLAFIAWAPLAKGFLARVSAGAALAWLLQHSPVLVPIPGTASIEHLEENLRALELDAAQVESLDRYRSLAFEARKLARRARVHGGRLKRRFR